MKTISNLLRSFKGDADTPVMFACLFTIIVIVGLMLVEAAS